MSAVPAQASVSSQWPLQYLKAAQVWSISKGSGTTVAVLDTGVASLPDTQGNLLQGANFGGSTTSSGNGQTDLSGHGTAMAAIIGGSGSSFTQGLAPSTKILPVIINDTALGNQPDQMAAAIEYAISQHVSVINLSQSIGQDSSVPKAIQDALNSDIVVVAASGDEGASTVDYPAAYSGVVAVGAVDQNGAIWDKSNTGRVTLAAPGVDVPTEDNVGSAASGSGTSSATAYVSATVALIRAEHPTWTVGQVIRDLIATADPASGQTAGQHSDQYGYGIVDPLKALQASAPSETSNPLMTAAGSSASAVASATATGGGGSASASKAGSGLVIGIVIAVVVVLLIVGLIVV
ncbi:S8 family serine peptidase, partial [Actinospica sp. MGRD01-02]